MRRALRWALGLVVALPLLGLAALWLFLDAEALKPRLAEAVERATGRAFSVSRLSLTPSLVPALAAEGVSLANAPGLEGPMLMARRAEVRLALLPLLSGRVELRRVEAGGVELRLERGNWLLEPAPSARRPEGAPPAAPPPGAGAPPRAVALGEVVLRDLALHVAGEVIRLPEARLSPEGELAATVAARGQEVRVTGRIPGLRDGPFQLRAELPAGATLAAEGERRGATATARLAAQAPALAALSPLAGLPLPALGDVVARAEVALGGGPPPRISALELRAGGSELGGAVRLSEARLAAEAFDSPVSVAARGSWEGRSFALSGTGPSLAAALAGDAPLPVALRLELPGGEASLSGPLPLAGRPAPAPLALEARLESLSAALGPRLPPLSDLRASARLGREGEGAWRVAALTLASSAGDLSGEGIVRTLPRPGFSGRLAASRLDLDALRAPAPTPAPAPAPPSGPAPAPAPAGPPRAIPDQPLPLAGLRGFDADLAFEAGELRAGGLALRQVAGRFRNEDGRARLDPLAFALPEAGRLELRAAADATLDPPALQVAGGGQGLNLAALFPGLDLSGRADLQMDLRGQGAGTRALAATLTGALGLAVVEGRAGPRLTRGLLAGLPGAAPGGSLPLACLALRAEADRGLLRPRVLYAETGMGRIAAEGVANLRDETLAMRLLADLRVAGLRLRAPVPLTGTFLNPALDWRGVAEGALAGDLGQQAERLLPGLGQVLRPGGGGGAGMPSLPECGPALREARFGRAGPAPPPARPAEEPAAPRGGNNPPQSLDGLLRGLLGR